MVFPNQSLIADESIYKANRGLLVLTNANAFAEADAQRYLREAIGLSPYRGSDLVGGGSEYPFGTNYFQVTPKGLTREWGYVSFLRGDAMVCRQLLRVYDQYRFS